MSTRRRPATSATPATPPYSSIPLRWPRGDGRFYHCCTMTIPLPDGCDERRLFVYWEPGSLAHDVIERSLKRICKLYSDPSLAPPWGTVLDLNAAVSADLIAGVVKGSAFVVLDRRLTDAPKRYALAKLTGGRFLGGLHPAKRRTVAPELRERAERHGRNIHDEEREHRLASAVLALAETATETAKEAYTSLRRAFLRHCVQDIAGDLPQRQTLTFRETPEDSEALQGDIGPGTASTPRRAVQMELAATLDVATRNAGLTQREKQVCQAKLDGKTLADWAAEQGIDAATARGYWSEARRKLRQHLD